MDYVVSSIRNPSEIQVLKRSKGFTLISIDAPLEDRYKRALSVGDKKFQAFDEFVESEQRERSNDPNGQRLHTCMDILDYYIFNPGTGTDSLRRLEQKIEELLIKLESEK